MIDRLLISDLEVWCVIGAPDEERLREQPVLVDLEIGVDAGAAARSDRLDAALDYAAVAERICNLAVERRFHLIESLADAIATVCLDEFGSSEVRVRVKKPGALRAARHAAIEVHRSAE